MVTVFNLIAATTGTGSFDHTERGAIRGVDDALTVTVQGGPPSGRECGRFLQLSAHPP